MTWSWDWTRIPRGDNTLGIDDSLPWDVTIVVIRVDFRRESGQMFQSYSHLSVARSGYKNQSLRMLLPTLGTPLVEKSLLGCRCMYLAKKTYVFLKDEQYVRSS